MSIPIVTVHGGDVFPGRDESYVQLVADQALRYNDRFILLGGERNRATKGVEWYNYFTDYSKDADHFTNHVHKKLSAYSRLYDVAVTKRYFVLREFMRAQGIPIVFSCDSDVMIYCDVERERPKGKVAFCIPKNQPDYRWSASSHAAYFTTAGINAICNFIEKMYTTDTGLKKLKSKWKWHQQFKKPGGVCDMTFLYLYSLKYAVTNLSIVNNDTAWDHHVNTPENWYPDEYRMSHTRRKQITWQDSQPYGYNEYLSRLIRFNGVHLQGGAKKYAPDYVRMRAKNY